MSQGIPENQSDTLESLKTQLAEAQQAKELAEKRIKDTQGAYTKSRQESKALEAKLEVLQDHLNSVQSVAPLPPELERLKLTDPEAWYRERLKFENQAKTTLNSKLQEAERKATNAEIYASFKAENPEITDDYIENEVPARLKADAQSGKISWEEFLNQVKERYHKGTAISGVEGHLEEQPNLSKMGSGEGVKDKKSDYSTFAETYRDIVI